MKRAPLWPLLFICACGGVVAPSPVAAPPDKSPRLIRHNKDLYIRNAPEGAIKGRLFYALAANPIPRTQDHPKIGILRGRDREGSSLKVTWIAVLDENVDKIVDGEGLPVWLIEQDREVRLGRHWGKYLPNAQTPFPGPTAPIVLVLNLGKDDGVKPHDKYEVLGEALTDDLNRMVDDFKLLGKCTIGPFDAESTRSKCQLDRGLDVPLFQKHHWEQGGYVRAISPRDGISQPP